MTFFSEPKIKQFLLSLKLLRGKQNYLFENFNSDRTLSKGPMPGASTASLEPQTLLLRCCSGCPTFWHLWATLEEEELSWATH